MVGTVMRLHPQSKRSKYSDRQVAGRAVALVLLLLLSGIGSAGCDARPAADRPPAGTRQAADPVLGQRLLTQYQCGSCHAIPGVAAARGIQGPSLQAFSKRSYIAGRIPNRPDALARWIVAPSALVPDTVMPDMGVSPADARNMAAYLGTLE